MDVILLHKVYKQFGTSKQSPCTYIPKCFPMSHGFFSKDTTPLGKFKTSFLNLSFPNCNSPYDMYLDHGYWIFTTAIATSLSATTLVSTSTIFTNLPLPPTSKLYTCISRGTQSRVGRQKGERGRSYGKPCCVYSTALLQRLH